jgi:hypothetical protein
MKTTYERVQKYTNTLNGRLRTLLKGARKSAKDRRQGFSICFEDIQKQWDKQKGVCLYTGWEMTTCTNDLALVSIERLDNAKGYFPENIILVCWCVNRARARMTKEDFVSMCNAVVKNHDKQQNG